MLDEPVFKILARNDTGQGTGHQAGMVIPADLEEYFPDITGTVSASAPTADVPVFAELIVGGLTVGNVETRFQVQTWGNTRSPERRLTSNLGPLRKAASAGDIVLFQRDLDQPDRMVLTLIRKGDAAYGEYFQLTGGRRWGPLFNQSNPAENRELRSAYEETRLLETQPFTMFAPARTTSTVVSRRKVRDAAFRKRLFEIHGSKCVVSQMAIRSPLGAVNLDAAHIVPIEAGGSDDPRNGILLSKDLHWAFDRGLFHVNDDYRVIVDTNIASMPSNTFLAQFDGHSLRLPGDTGLFPHREAFAWHRENRANRWNQSGTGES